VNFFSSTDSDVECLKVKNDSAASVYQVGQKSKPLLIYQYIASYVRNALLFCMYTNSGTTAS